MLDPVSLNLSGARFSVTYAIAAEKTDARAIAEKICVEQTIEFPPELVADDDIRGEVIGQIEHIEETAPGVSEARITYAEECAGGALPQLLNVMYGNISLLPNIRILTFDLPPSLSSLFKGPRFGLPGLRKLFDRPSGPLFMTATKPQGLPVTALAAQARDCALGGLDIVKDDHGLANQPFAPFRERLKACADAVAEANARTGGNTVYAPMISGPSERIIEDAYYAKDVGAGALLVAPALVGFDVARRLAEDDALSLPIVGHPALIGSYAVAPLTGFSFSALFGRLFRLIGMDVSIFPNFGGRFSLSREECREIVTGCAEDFGAFAPIAPAPGGGMTFQNVPEMAAFYGEDVMYLMGGDLHRQETPLAESCKRLRALANAA